jgi:hypothetical protein
MPNKFELILYQSDFVMKDLAIESCRSLSNKIITIGIRILIIKTFCRRFV